MKILKFIGAMTICLSVPVILMGCNDTTAKPTTQTGQVQENTQIQEPSVEADIPEVEEPEKEPVAVEESKKLSDLVQISKDPYVKPLEEMLDRPVTPENSMGGYRAYPFISDKGFAYQVISMEPKKLVVDIGNTGNSPFTVDLNNLSFAVYDFSGNNISGSKIEGGTIVINPGEVERIVLTATHESSVNVDVTINGAPLQIQCSSEFGEDITDTRPFDGESPLFLDQPVPVIEFAGRVTGNDKFKAVSKGVIILEDQSFKGLPKLYTDGAYVLVNVKFANISNEPIELKTIRGVNYNPTTDDYEVYEVQSETLDYLGEFALPMTISPNTIVEGYIPAVLVGNDYNSNMGIMFSEDPMDGFIIDLIEGLKVVQPEL